MKKRFTFVLCALLAFTFIFTGCQIKSPEEQVKQIEQNIANSKQMAGRLNGTLEMGTGGMKFKADLDSNLKYDNSGDFPAVDFDGNLNLEGLGSTGFRVFINKDMIYSSAIGSENTTKLDEESRTQIINSFKSLQSSSVNGSGQFIC